MTIAELTTFLRGIAKAQVKHEMVRRFLSHPRYYPIIKEKEDVDPGKLVPPANTPTSEAHGVSMVSGYEFEDQVLEEEDLVSKKDLFIVINNRYIDDASAPPLAAEEEGRYVY